MEQKKVLRKTRKPQRKTNLSHWKRPGTSVRNKRKKSKLEDKGHRQNPVVRCFRSLLLFQLFELIPKGLGLVILGPKNVGGKKNNYGINRKPNRFHILKLLNIHKINDFFTACFTFNLWWGLFHPILALFMYKIQTYINIIPEGQNITPKINYTKKRTNHGNFPTRNKLISIWNSTPSNIQESPSFRIFNNNMESHILNIQVT